MSMLIDALTAGLGTALVLGLLTWLFVFVCERIKS
jgi:hypothetical protein